MIGAAATRFLVVSTVLPTACVPALMIGTANDAATDSDHVRTDGSPGLDALDSPRDAMPGDNGPPGTDAPAVDDSAPPAPGTILWARSASSVFLYGVVEGSVGVLVSAVLSAPANLGGSLLAPEGATDVAMGEYGSSDGSHLFSSRFGDSSPAGTSTVYGYLTTLDFAGNPIIQGTSSCNPSGMPACTQVDVGAGLQSPGGGSGGDGYIGRYSVTSGMSTWVDRLVGPGTDILVTSTPGPNSTIFCTGWYDQTTNFIAGTDTRMLLGQGDRDVMLAQISPYTGEISMVQPYADPAFEQPTSVAWTGSNIILGGFFSGTMTAFGGSVTSQDFDFFVAKLMPDGTPVWVVPLGGSGPDKYPSFVVDASGDIYLAGSLTGSAMFGTHPVGGAGGIDVVVAKLNGSDGSVAWATSFGSSGDDSASDIAVNASGQLLVSANVVGSIAPGGPWAGDSDAALVSYTSSGTMLWSKVIGTTGTDYGSNVAASASGAFYANLNMGANIGPTIEGVSIQGAPDPTGVLVKIAP